MCEVKDLRLVQVDGQPCGTRLRQFLVRVCAARSKLELPSADEPLSLASTGVRLPAEYSSRQPRCNSLHELLTRMHYCLNLSEESFRKPGSFLVKEKACRRRTAKTRLTWAVYLALHSVEFAERSLADPRARRPDIAKQLRDANLLVWDESFHYTAVLKKE